MTRDYTDFMNMTPEELAAYALEHARGNDLMLALAHQLQGCADVYDANDRLTAELADAERRADSWREEAQAIQRQLDMVRG